MQRKLLHHLVNFNSKFVLNAVAVFVDRLLPEVEHLLFIDVALDAIVLAIEQI